jgi:hypothetical protein
MILATIESNSEGISSPSAIPVSTRSPGPLASRTGAAGQPKPFDDPRRRREVVLRILGVQAHFDRMSPL